MPRRHPLPDQYTGTLQLKCDKANCGKEFLQKGARSLKHHAIFCSACGTLVVAGEDKILRLLSEQIKRITDVVEGLEKNIK